MFGLVILLKRLIRVRRDGIIGGLNTRRTIKRNNVIYGSRAFCLALPAFSVSWAFRQSVELLGRGISPPQGRYLHTGQHKQNKRTQISIPHVGFEPTIPAIERAKAVDALDRAATVLGERKNMGTLRRKSCSRCRLEVAHCIKGKKVKLFLCLTN
jgi:hypothetical protein